MGLADSLEEGAQAPGSELHDSMGSRGKVCFIYVRNLFGGMPKRFISSSPPVVRPHASSSNVELALQRFCKLRRCGVEADDATLSSVIIRCGPSNRLETGMSLHCLVIKRGLQNQLFIASSLIGMYSKCGMVELARRLFDQMPEHDAVSWNSMLSSYWRAGLIKDAVEMFSVVLRSVFDRAVLVNNFTFSGALKACANWGGIVIGRALHAFVIKLKFEQDLFVMVSLIDMYAKNGSLFRACLIFEKMGKQDVVAWSAMISGYVRWSREEEAVRLFQMMRLEGFLPDEITLTNVLSASAGLEHIVLGRSVHALIIKHGYLSDSFVQTTLVDMYAKCSEMEDAESAFMLVREKNLVTLNALITGYGLMQMHDKALLAYANHHSHGMRPDTCTFTSLLSSCSPMALAEGSQVHCHTIKFGLDFDIFIGSSLVSFYSKCGDTESAAKAFGSILNPNAVCWAGIISCFVQNDEGEKAVKYFRKMHISSEMPNEFSLSAVCKACADMTASEQSKNLHALVIKIGLESAIFVGSSLVDMYCKCGMVEDSLKIFISMPRKNVATWNAIIVGLAQNGLCKKALELFHVMVNIGFTPDPVTFIGVLVACNNAGLVDEGRSYFGLMTSLYKISPTIEHCTCMVDLLGRAGYLCEADALVDKYSLAMDPIFWRSMLVSCVMHGNKELARRTSEKCLLSDPQSSGMYVLLSNMYAFDGLWSKVVEVRNSMNGNKIRKETGHSSIEIRNKIYVFISGQRLGLTVDVMSALLIIHVQMLSQNYLLDQHNYG